MAEPMMAMTALISIQESRITMGEDFQMLLVLAHSLPCSSAALKLAAGVRKARCMLMTTMMTGISSPTPILVQ